MEMEKLYGKYRAKVVDANDPDGAGRLLVMAPVLAGGVRAKPAWATACVPPGQSALPEPGATVWIEFEEGDLDRPLWTGCAWAAPPFPNPVQVDPAGTVRIVSVSRVVLTAPSVRVEAPLLKSEGIVEGTQLIASIGVISPSYTPGVGNLQ